MNKKLDDKIRQKLISLIPEMKILKAGGCTYKKIAEFLEFKYSIKLPVPSPEIFLKTFISPERYEKYNPIFSKYAILREVSDLSLFPCCVSKYGCIFTLRELVTDGDYYLINRRNIHMFENLSSCLIAKRIMRFHDLADEIILLARESIGLSNSMDEHLSPDYISENILEIFDDFQNSFNEEFIKYNINKTFSLSY
jgi:hypothetical protein